MPLCTTSPTLLTKTSGSNDAGIFDGPTTTFCLVMLIFNMVAKIVAIYCFLRFYKEMEAGAFRVSPPENASTRLSQGRGAKHQGAGRSGAYDMAPMSTREINSPVGSPTGESSLVIRKEAVFPVS